MADDASTFKYAQVLVELDAKALDRRTFSYCIPDGMNDAIDIGTPVSVPFGRMKQITGYVVGFTNYVDPGIRMKDITDVLDEEPLFDLAYLEFLDWIAHYYATSLMTVLAAALPTSMIQKTRREVVLHHDQLSTDYSYNLPVYSQQILSFLKSRPEGKGIRVRYLASQTGIPLKLVNQALYKLQRDNVVSLQSMAQGGMGEKRIKWVQLLPHAETDNLTKRQQVVLEALSNLPDETLKLSEATQKAGTTTATLKKLDAHGVLRIFDAPAHRDRDPLFGYTQAAELPPLALSEEQDQVVTRILSERSQHPYTVHGVTGSGKTEVYIALVQAMLNEGKSCLILVPEISLTSHIAKRFIERFGQDQLVLWHSHLSAGEKVDAWRRIHRGELNIVIGARSAIFAPLQQLGLIILDEEHEGSFKQESPNPRYHARTLAKQLAERQQTLLVLGSATPDLESYYTAEKQGQLLTLTQRYGNRPLATVDIVDMTQLKGFKGALSATLIDALKETVANEQQAILLLNRRGFNTLITCNVCFSIFECPNCSVALTYHRFRDQARCHYCGYENDKPQFCPECASYDLVFRGLGTQRLEEEVAEKLPNARLLRLDSDMMTKKFAFRDILDAFAANEADILIGTQMVAKGLDVANVTLVGVVAADTAFSMPDYKASERGFQLLTQVAGRSGRGDKPGRVIIQTYQPEHPVVQRAQDQDYDGFYHDEIHRRQEWEFPPYCQLFRFIVQAQDEFRTREFIKALTLNLEQILKELDLSDAIDLLGPAPCVISRIQGKYRYHVMVKNKAGQAGHEAINTFYSQLDPPDDLQCILDVDAQSFL